MAGKEEATVVARASREKEGEERKKKRERKKKAARQFKLRPVTSSGLAQLSRATYSGATDGHAA
jgi:hypothetical protein